MLGMAADKKNTASLIIQMGGDCYPEEEKESGRSGLKAAAEGVLEAVDKRDADSLAYSLKSFIKMCMAEYEKEEDSEEGEEKDKDMDFLGGYSDKKW